MDTSCCPVSPPMTDDELFAHINAFVSMSSLSVVYTPGDPFLDKICMQLFSDEFEG